MECLSFEESAASGRLHYAPPPPPFLFRGGRGRESSRKGKFAMEENLSERGALLLLRRNAFLVGL